MHNENLLSSHCLLSLAQSISSHNDLSFLEHVILIPYCMPFCMLFPLPKLFLILNSYNSIVLSYNTTSSEMSSPAIPFFTKLFFFLHKQ